VKKNITAATGTATKEILALQAAEMTDRSKPIPVILKKSNPVKLFNQEK
jgi:hypothetical protein